LSLLQHCMPDLDLKKAKVHLAGFNQDMRVHSLRAKRLTVGDFPGFKAVDISHSTLKLVVKEQIDSWRSALSSVAGVYLISDREHHMLYVGSATGEGGIWARWETYAHGGHGGNVRLKALKAEKGKALAHSRCRAKWELARPRVDAHEALARKTKRPSQGTVAELPEFGADVSITVGKAPWQHWKSFGTGYTPNGWGLSVIAVDMSMVDLSGVRSISSVKPMHATSWMQLTAVS
nr:hypothetical protein [Tanacetum cinerariifolium]